MDKLVLPATLKEAREKKAAIDVELKAWADRVKEGKEKFDDKEVNEKWDRMVNDSIELKKHCDRLEKIQNLEFEQAKEAEQKGEEKKEKKDVSKAFEKFLRFGPGKLNPDEMASIRTAQGTTSDAVGGVLVPEGFQAELEKAILPYVAVLQPGAARVIRTSTGNDLVWPTVNDTSNKGELLAENPESDTSEQGVTFSSKTLKAYTFSSKYVLVSQQLLQDSVINVEEVLRDLLAERLGRILADYFTTGTGSSQPGGIVYQATDSGVTPATAAITRANILDLMFSVNSSYRNNGAFMFNDSTLKTIMKLTFASGDDRPLWQPNIIGSAPDRLEGRPYFINDVMDGVAAGKDSMIFGDLSKFIVRSVRETQLFVFREKFMAKLQIGFLAWNRWDSVLLDAGTHPIKKLHHHLT